MLFEQTINIDRKLEKNFSSPIGTLLKNNQLFPVNAVTKIYVNKYERNPLARRICIEHYGAVCSVCGFNFEQKYGEIGKGFIHVHHIIQMSELQKGYQLDPIKDLMPVCPNCHAILHRKNPILKISELKDLIQTN